MFQLNKKRYDQPTDTIYMLVNRYEQMDHLSACDECRLKDCADELWGMGKLADEWRKIANEVLDEIKCNGYEG